MQQPLIAITAGEIHNRIEPWSPTVHGQSVTYLDAVHRAGGIPLIIPIIDDESVLRRLYELADGILFAGGNDINPERYGQTAYATTNDISELRDSVELRLMNWALDDAKPMLCICRGMQLLNVCRGGSLYQDIPADLPQASDHHSSTKRQTLVDMAHQLRIATESALANIVGSETLATNTHHHQAIRQVGQGLSANCWSEDGIIEGVETSGTAQYVIGIQSHPESLQASAVIRWQKLFSSFTDAARSYAVSTL